MSADAGLIEWAAEALAPMGTVTHRRMMGGATLYLDGIVFAITHKGDLWFTADAETDTAWDAEGCARFTHEGKDGRIASMNYRLAPSACHDDADELQRWAALAVAAGLRAAVKKKPRKKG